MFGVELERRWGTIGFAKYYFVTGIGAGLCVVAGRRCCRSRTPAQPTSSSTIGASGAVYGLLLAWAMLFPHRQILFMFIFPLPARIFVLIVGAIAFFSALGGESAAPSPTWPISAAWSWAGSTSRARTNLRLELKYRLTRWRMERMRRRFDVHRGGRDNWRDRIH